MAKQIIILDQVSGPSTSFRYLFWAAVPLARQPFYANPGAKSIWTGASAAENTALQLGQVVEKGDVYSVPTGATIAAIKASLQTMWAAYQATITASNHWSQYGTFWDGTTWTTGGVS